MNKLLKLFQQSRLQLLVIVLLTLSSIAAIAFVDFNFGVDYAHARVVSVQIDHEVALADIQDAVTDYPVQHIEELGTSRFMLYFDELSAEKQGELTTKLEVDLAKATVSVYDYHSEPLFALRERLISMAIVTSLAILLFTYATLRKLGLNNGQLLALLGVEIVSAAILGLMLVAMLLGLSAIGLEVTRAGLTSTGAVGFVQLFLSLVFIQQFEHKEEILSHSWRALAQKLWPVYVLVVVVVAFAMVSLPLLVSDSDLLLVTIVTGVGVILGLFSQFVLKPLLLGLTLPALPSRTKASITATQVHPKLKKKTKLSKK